MTEISPAELTETLSRQRTAFIEDGPPGLKTRVKSRDVVYDVVV